jgi:hypothetical protein
MNGLAYDTAESNTIVNFFRSLVPDVHIIKLFSLSLMIGVTSGCFLQNLFIYFFFFEFCHGS